jgi:hypothetical protein
MPPAPRKALLVASALLLALASTACSGGGDDAAKKKRTETSSEAFVHASVKLDVTRAEVVSPHKALATLDKGTVAAVRGVVEKLLLVTSAKPLVEGRTGAGFAALFTPDAGARAAGHDRAVFFDEGAPRFGALKPTTARIGMTGLAGSMDPKTELVVAKFVWDVASAQHAGDAIHRSGELSLIPVKGGWKIGAYTVVVTRTLSGATTTTTAASR